MDQDKLWATFEKTGKVQDYLRYCGVDVYGSGENSVAGAKETSNETDDRCADHTRKQHRR